MKYVFKSSSRSNSVLTISLLWMSVIHTVESRLSDLWLSNIPPYLGIPFALIFSGQSQFHRYYRSLFRCHNRFSSRCPSFFQVIKLGIRDSQFWWESSDFWELSSMSRSDIWQFTHLHRLSKVLFFYALVSLSFVSITCFDIWYYHIKNNITWMIHRGFVVNRKRAQG
jgi:hypothetical protein